MSENTVKLVTPIGEDTIEIKSIVTGFDQEAIDIERERNDEDEKLPPMQRANRKSIEVLVKSVTLKDSKTPVAISDIVQTVLGFDVRDYNYVIRELNKLSSPLEPAKKKPSTKDT